MLRAERATERKSAADGRDGMCGKRRSRSPVQKQGAVRPAGGRDRTAKGQKWPTEQRVSAWKEREAQKGAEQERVATGFARQRDH